MYKCHYGTFVRIAPSHAAAHGERTTPIVIVIVTWSRCFPIGHFAHMPSTNLCMNQPTFPAPYLQLRSPQLQQAGNALTAALDSANMSAIYSNFGLRASDGSAAMSSDPSAALIAAVQARAEREAAASALPAAAAAAGAGAAAPPPAALLAEASASGMQIDSEAPRGSSGGAPGGAPQ